MDLISGFPFGLIITIEHVVAFIAKLRTPGERRYAERQWRYVKGQNSQPDHRTFGVSDTDAQKIRIHLAGMK
jgi:hypothetical protein